MMFTRTVTITGATDIDAGLRYLRDTVAPLLVEKKGFRGVIASADWVGQVLGVLWLWETEAERDASESVLVQAREQGLQVIVGEMTVEHFEELLVEIAEPPTVGSALLLRQISMDPASVEEHLGFFKREVVPQMKASPGFRAVMNMIDRRTGGGMVGSFWADEASLDVWAEAAEKRRQEAAGRGVTFGVQSKREIVFADLR